MNISEQWIKQYVDALLSSAGKLEPGIFRDAMLLRANHIMDLVESWRENETRKNKHE